MENNLSIYELRHRENQFKQSSISQQIRLLAEVEKIWIQHDIDENGVLDF